MKNPPTKTNTSKSVKLVQSSKTGWFIVKPGMKSMTYATTGAEGARDGNKGAEENRGGNTTFTIVVLSFLDKLSRGFPR